VRTRTKIRALSTALSFCALSIVIPLKRRTYDVVNHDVMQNDSRREAHEKFRG
jgi:hypothetical protein